MKNYLFIGFFIAGSVQAACTKPVNEKEIILFVDTNQSELEIATARASACQRGQKLVTVAGDEKARQPLLKRFQAADAMFRACEKADGSCENIKILSALDEATGALSAYNEDHPLRTDIEAALKKTKLDGAKIKSFIISGHDGGGMFSGNKGETSKKEILEAMTAFPEVNDVTSVLLLGCYSNTPVEVPDWRNIFPKARLIGGYDESAPLSDKPLGHQYISELLESERGILQANDDRKLSAYTKQNLKSLQSLNAAVFVAPLCIKETNTGYYLGVNAAKKPRQFSSFEYSECEAQRESISSAKQKLDSYLFGESEPPKSTASGPTRDLYNTLRSLEHCFEATHSEVDMKKMFGILFYEGMKSNFANYYAKDLASAESLLSQLTVQEFKKNADEEMKTFEDVFRRDEETAKLIESDSEAYIANLKARLGKLSGKNAYEAAEANAIQSSLEMLKTPGGKAKLVKISQSVADMTRKAINDRKADVLAIIEKPDRLKAFFVPTAANLAKKTRKEFIQNIHDINTVMSMPGMSNSPAYKALEWMSKASQKHLVEFKNPFSWHEASSQPQKPEAEVHINSP
jgi:hypothetical protein